MAFAHGKSASIMFNGYDVTSYLNDASTSATVETAETTAFGNSAKTYIVGLDDSTVSMSGMFEGSAAGSDVIFHAAATSSADNIVTIFPDGRASVGKRAMLAAGKLTSYEVKTPVSDVVAISTELQASGGRDNGVMLAGDLAYTTALTGTSVNNGAATTNGGVGHLHITANTMTGTTIVKIQNSADGSTGWADILTFSTVNSTVTTALRAEITGNVLQYIRATIAFSGSGSVNAYVAFARR